MPEKQKLKNKGNYVDNLTGKIQEQRLQDNRTRVSFVSLASSYSHFCRNSLELSRHNVVNYSETPIQ